MINNLFDAICRYGYFIRKYKISGKNGWNLIKKKLELINLIINGGWTTQSYTIYKDFLNHGIIEDKRFDMSNDDWVIKISKQSLDILINGVSSFFITTRKISSKTM